MTSKPSQKPSLGRLEKVDLRTCWSEEGAEFTLWLAQAENIEMLGEALDLDLAVVEREAAADSIADILCRDPINDRLVLIVHQLEGTNADRLGQLLSAMASLQAVTVIWIAGNVTAEHQTALTWLNQITLPEFHFFGVELELWRIGKSMAPKFSLIVQPPEWAELESAELSEEVEPKEIVEPLTERQLQNLEFWSGLCYQLEHRGSIVKPSDPATESEMSFAIGRAGFRLYTRIDEDLNSLSTGLLLSGEDAKPHLYLLEEEREAIEAEVGIPLEWDTSGDDKANDKNCYIYCVLGAVDFGDREQWKDYHQWFCLYLEQFHEVFADRIKHLNANDYRPKPDYSFNPVKPSASLPGSSSAKSGKQRDDE
jgi:alkylhydroperoxidase family enzyme